jgi:hypothetical protein
MIGCFDVGVAAGVDQRVISCANDSKEATRGKGHKRYLLIEYAEAHGSGAA